MEQNKVETSENKQLPDVFKELKKMRSEQIIGQTNNNQTVYDKMSSSKAKSFFKDLKSKSVGKTILYSYFGFLVKLEDFTKVVGQRISTTFKNGIGLIRKEKTKEKSNTYEEYIRGQAKTKLNIKEYIPSLGGIKSERKTISIALIISVFIGFFAITGTSNFILATDIDKKIEPQIPIGSFEPNNSNIDLMQVISGNISVTKKKVISVEEIEIEHETIYQENKTMPKDEMVVIQEGNVGIKELTIIRTFENEDVTTENIINENILEEPVTKVIDVGTSEFLAKYKIYLGDLIYATNEIGLKISAREDADELIVINKNLDMKLLEIIGDNEEWLRVNFDHYNGYIKTENLTSASIRPQIVEECRLTKILMRVDFTMDVHVPSGLTLNDFKNVLSNESRDINKIFENNAEEFYRMERKYNINGIFLASIGIHESAWGTSNIARSKKNLFGYGAYDNSPYDSAFTFSTYEEGIDLVARVLVKNYLNMHGVRIYDDELATGIYYNGPTVPGVNVRYASDEFWCQKVYEIMRYLYGKLEV